VPSFWRNSADWTVSLSDVPLQQIAADAAAGRLDVKPARIFGFDEIREAHRIMEANQAGGKLVVVHH